MRKALVLTLLTLIASFGAAAEDRHQSYISYDDGGTVVRTGDDGREIEAHRNLPIYPGDEVVTGRRGRSEVRLSDGNIIGIDRATAVRFRSMLDSYEGDADQTVAELRYGKVAVHRTDVGRERVRLDTENASYMATNEAIYSVETDTRGRDRVLVFEGSVEVRTPNRSTRLRSGEAVTVDGGGVYEVISSQRAAADDFERWFLSRAERFSGRSTRYVDRRLSYWADDLDDHGRWVFVTGIGWSWRPYVAAGWRPYHHGYWHHSRHGSLVWVSYDPWGWAPYHYGRWAHDPMYGWIWVPGHGYSPAWVYWWYGPSYVGWAPAGWWDCYRPYYRWAYHPYSTRTVGFGFYGRVRISEMDLRPWTFVDSGRLVSTRVDRAALTTDAVKHRFGRGSGDYATISGSPARFTREEFRDPAESIRRRSLDPQDGVRTGRESGAPPTDLTPFFRRDENVGTQVRDRIVRARGAAPGAETGQTSTPTAGGSVAPIGGGSVAPIGRGSVAPIGRGASPEPSVPAAVDRGRGGDDGRIDRGAGRGGSQPAAPAPRGGDRVVTPREGPGREALERPSAGGSAAWRDRGSAPAVTPAPSPASGEPSETPRARDAWRDRSRGGDPPSTTESPSARGSAGGSSDVPRRVIEQIGGARVVPRDRSGDGGSASGREDRSTGSREVTRPGRPSGGSGASQPRDSGSSSRSGDSGSVRSRDGGSSRSADSGSSTRSSGGSRESSGGSRDSGGGRVRRDN